MMAKNGIPIGLPRFRFKTKLIAAEGDGLIDVADDEEWRNRWCGRRCHKYGRATTAYAVSSAELILEYQA